MTTALFGDDPATGIVEGLAEEVLHFAFRGSMANETLVFGGNMAHKTLALTFDELEAGLSVFPNPPSIDHRPRARHRGELGHPRGDRRAGTRGAPPRPQPRSWGASGDADLDALEVGTYNVCVQSQQQNQPHPWL